MTGLDNDIFNESAPRPIQSISHNVHVSYVVQCFSVNILLLPFTTVESQVIQLQKDSFGNSYKRTVVSEFAILAQKQFFF